MRLLKVLRREWLQIVSVSAWICAQIQCVMSHNWLALFLNTVLLFSLLSLLGCTARMLEWQKKALTSAHLAKEWESVACQWRDAYFRLRNGELAANISPPESKWKQ